MEQVVGTCSICGGDVVFPSLMVNPRCYCKRCGATEDVKRTRPTIPMKPARDTWVGGPMGDMEIAPR